jgi:hypothetical protein
MWKANKSIRRLSSLHRDSIKFKVSGKHRSGRGGARFRDPSNDLNEAKRLNGWNDLNQLPSGGHLAGYLFSITINATNALASAKQSEVSITRRKP